LIEPPDRLERSSPGYRPGTSPSTLEGQGAAVVTQDDKNGHPRRVPEPSREGLRSAKPSYVHARRRLADVRHAVCRRVLHPRPSPNPLPVSGERGEGRARSRLELQGSESNRPGSRLMRPGRAQPSLHECAAGGRGIEPRWLVLETSLIPDRDPGAPVWNRTSISCASGRRHHQIGFESKIVAAERPRASCPATGIVDYLIVKDHSRPSPRWLPRLIGMLWIDVSRSRCGACLPYRAIERRNKKSRRGRLHQGGFRKNL
jgi:hypothetical protein